MCRRGSGQCGDGREQRHRARAAGRPAREARRRTWAAAWAPPQPTGHRQVWGPEEGGMRAV